MAGTVMSENSDIEARMRRHDGVFRWFLIRFEPFRDDHREDRHVVRGKH